MGPAMAGGRDDGDRDGGDVAGGPAANWVVVPGFSLRDGGTALHVVHHDCRPASAAGVSADPTRPRSICNCPDR
jgi:hypothetical protein